MASSAIITNGIGAGGTPSSLISRGLTPGITGSLLPSPVNVVQALGTPTLLNSPATPYTIFIDGVDRSNYIRAGIPVGPGITFDRRSGARAIATFQVYESSGVYAPAQGDQVLIFEFGVLTYRGIVDKIVSTRVTGSKEAVFSNITCVDYGGLLDKRIYAKKYDTAASGGVTFNAWTVLYEVVTTSAFDLGLTLHWEPILDTFVDGLIFNYIPCTEVFNIIAQLINCEWTVDCWLNCYFYSKTLGSVSALAPGPFLTNSKNWLQFKVTRNRALFANRVFAKSSRAIASTRTDTTFILPGSPSHVPINNPITYPEYPTVTVNGVPKVVVWPQDFGPGGIAAAFAPGAPYFDFYLFGGYVLVYNPLLPPLNTFDVVVVTYTSYLAAVRIAEDAASILADGLQELVIECGDVPTLLQLQAIADGALLRSQIISSDIEVVTRDRGYDIRQLVAVNIDVPPVNESYVITAITSKEISKKYFEHTITAHSEEIQHAADMARYLGMVVGRARAPVDRIIERFDFVVAGTIEGLTNPGLTTGLKTPVHIVEKDSLLAKITINFNSINTGTPTTSDIVIDVLRNGVSVFGANPMLTLRAGKSVAMVVLFATDPYPIFRGDKFTFEILAADSSAKDGALDIVGVG